MTDHAFAELAPLAALGALDGEDLSTFEGHVRSCLICRAELDRLEAAAGRIALAVAPVPPPRELRERVLAAATAARPGAVATPAPGRRRALIAAAAVVALAAGGVWLDRDRLQQDVAVARAAAREAEARAERAEAELDRVRVELARDQALHGLLAHPTSRVASLAGLPAAPLAHARIVWNADRREGVLVTLGLAPAPAGKAYELWVIAQSAPVPAGVFQVDAEGRVVFRVPPVETAGATTFAITLEPAAGVPAPTGPMVLAGSTS